MLSKILTRTLNDLLFPQMTRRHRSVQSSVAAIIEVLQPRHLLSGNTITVDLLGDTSVAGHVTLRDAVGIANSDATADTIEFAPNLSGTITLTQGELSISTSMTITGPGANQLTISGGGSSRIFEIDDGNAGVMSHVVISGLTLTEGNAAGVLDSGNGGAIDNHEELTLIEDQFFQNTSLNVGGAVFTDYLSILTSKNSTYSANHSGQGGAIGVNFQAKLDSSGNTFSENSATYNGGAINSDHDNIMNSANDTFVGNFTTNANSRGGAISIGLYNVTSTINDTLTENSSGTGGGIFLAGSNLDPKWTVISTIIVGNVATSPVGAPNIQVSGSPTAIHAAQNLIGDANSAALAGIKNGVNGNLIGGTVTSIFQADANDHALLADHGGPTQTIALNSTGLAIGSGALDFLAAPITDTTSTTMTLKQGLFFPFTGATALQIDSEIVIVTGRVGNTLTVLRGQYSTVASTHAVNAPVILAFDQTEVVRSHANMGSVDLSIVDQPPIVSGFDTDVSYTENAFGTVLDRDVTVTDPDSVNFSTGTLTVAIIGNFESSDRIQIANVGTGPNQIGTNGSNVTYGGTTIGTFTGTTSLAVTFNTNATAESVQALLRIVIYSSVSENPSTLPRTAQVVLTDGDGGTSPLSTKLIHVIAIDDGPQINGFDTTVTYTENGAGSVLDTDATITDADSPNFDSGVFTVAVLTNFESTDRLGIRNIGVGPGQIGVNGSGVTYGGVVIGTLSGTTSLTVNLNAYTTPISVQALLRNVIYFSTSDNPSTLPRTIRAYLTDGDGATSNFAVKTVNVVAVNDAPTIAAFDTSITYTENGTGTVLDSDVVVSDPDSPNMDSGVLTVAIVDNFQSTDRISIRNLGTGPGQIGVNGVNVTYGGIQIGTYTGTNSLVVTLNSNATPGSVQALLRNVTYSSVSENPSTLPRTVRVYLTDGDGGTSNYGLKTINVVAVNDSPIVAGFDTSVTYVENATGLLLDTNVTISDADSPNFDGGKLTVALTTNTQATDRIGIRNLGTGTGQIGISGSDVTYGGTVIGSFNGVTTLYVMLNANATPTAVQALVRNVTYSSLSENPSTLPRTVIVGLTDGDGGAAVVSSKTINVLAINDAPAINGFDSSVTYLKNSAGVVLDADATVADVDSANFDTGRLTVSLTENAQSSDRIGIRNQGSSAGQIGINGTNVTYGGVVIGSFAGLTTLTVTFNANSTPLAAQSLLRNIIFYNVTSTPSTSQRTVVVRLTDGDGGTSLASSKTIDIA